MTEQRQNSLYADLLILDKENKEWEEALLAGNTATWPLDDSRTEQGETSPKPNLATDGASTLPKMEVLKMPTSHCKAEVDSCAALNDKLHPLRDLGGEGRFDPSHYPPVKPLKLQFMIPRRSESPNEPQSIGPGPGRFEKAR
uniref:Uncharacterized protein n=2 Tax=Lotharella globosa TaxID=91324 RepID=A0A7S4DVF5_9EUKA